MGNECTTYNSKGYCIDHLETEVHSEKQSEIHQNGAVDVAASVPIKIDGNIIVFVVVLIAIMLCIFLWRRNRFGLSGNAKRLAEYRQHQKLVRDQQMLQIMVPQNFPMVPEASTNVTHENERTPRFNLS